MKRYDYIDAMRGWAILSVIAFHCLDGSYTFPEEIKTVFLHGNKGVQLFYIISAFTIFLTLKQRETVERKLFTNFFIRRFFRIAPMYYLAIIFSLILFSLGIAYQYGEITSGNILSNFTFMHGVSPYWINGLVPGGWSITVEMMFYISAPFLLKKIKSLSAAILFLILGLFVSALYSKFLLMFPLIDNISLWNEFVYFSFPNQLPVFASGIVLYFIVCERDRISSEVVLVMGFYVLLSLLSSTFRLPIIFYFSVAFCLIIYALSRHKNLLLVNKLTLFTGKASYSMYITHFAILFFLKKNSWLNITGSGTPLSDLLNFAFTLLVTVFLTSCVSAITYNLVEYPFQKLAKNITQKTANEKDNKAFA
jgi:peptidoglycan/LPS O-acetylase OafA/YrhL